MSSTHEIENSEIVVEVTDTVQKPCVRTYIVLKRSDKIGFSILFWSSYI